MAKITSSTGLNVGTEIIIHLGYPSTTVELVATGNLVAKDGVTMQAIYTKLIKLWTSSTYNKYPFPLTVEAINSKVQWSWGYDGAYYNGSSLHDDTSRSYVRDGGWSEYLSDGTLDRQYFNPVSIGTLNSGAQPYYQKTSGGSATNFAYSDTVNEAILVYEDGGIDNRAFFKLYAREYAYKYDSSNLDTLGETATGAYRLNFPLSNTADPNITDVDATVASTTPYTGITATWLTGNNFDTTNTSPYSVNDVVKDGAGRWYICTGAGTADSTDYSNLGTMAGAGTATFSSYTGERDINGIYYAFNIIIDGNSATKEQIHTKLQYLLRQSGDIDSGSGTHLGKVTDVLSTITAGVLTTTTGVYIDNTLSADSAFLVYTDVGGVERSIPVVTNQSVTITGPTAGSRIQIYDLTSSTELYNGTPTFPYTWTDPSVYVADRQIRLRVAYVNAGTTANQFFSGTIGTATATEYALSYLFAPETDTVYAANAIDGSAVTDVVKNNATDRIEINKASGTISAAQLYAYEMYYLFGATGIAADPQVITAIDTANYLVGGSYKFKNVTSGPNKELIITGGWLRDSSTGLSITTVDTTGYTIFNAPDHVVAYATSGGTESDYVNTATGEYLIPLT